ncbi:protein of unknown function [Paraburkholderia dioscoreae]|uniref:Uncharacterized protein n=1 Tax=Paraburkholderia dioscoreae TaxID=2604047 RepID=A0A5Q4YVQ0_9BURK|nr:protein of unknown function [Paraburkholderia dioscoreae]
MIFHTPAAALSMQFDMESIRGATVQMSHARTAAEDPQATFRHLGRAMCTSQRFITAVVTYSRLSGSSRDN